jgi:ribose transport system substrate-binding protein
MNKLRIIVSLPNENAYQRAQGIAAKSTGEHLGFDIEVIHAGDDAITQSQQLLKIVQSRSEPRPYAFLVEPVTGAGLHRVAHAAVADGVAWVISNCDVDYIQQLRKTPETSSFAVTQGQMEIGRIQGRQIAALLPAGGSVLYIQGPSSSSVSAQRREGMEFTKRKDIRITTLRSSWSEESACRAVGAWLRLATSRAEKFDLVAGHTHELALGARKALQDMGDHEQQKRWLGLPFVGVGIAQQVEPLVDGNILTAAVVTSLTMELALKTLVHALKTKVQPPEYNFVDAFSYPSLEQLQRLRQKRAGLP